MKLKRKKKCERCKLRIAKDFIDCGNYLLADYCSQCLKELVKLGFVS